MATTSIAGYLALFAGTALLFVFGALLIGKLVRAQKPTPLKLEPYECGEPAVGSTAVQFDLRFYVVALVFIIFEVEVALFFPTATIFGKSIQLMNPGTSERQAVDVEQELGMTAGVEKFAEQDMYLSRSDAADGARTLALAAMADLGLFFAVILVGFAYVWRRGDLDWVRAVSGGGGA